MSYLVNLAETRVGSVLVSAAVINNIIGLVILRYDTYLK